jgi:MoxR-like ATPase
MAYTNGRKNVNEYDCLMLQHTMWQRPEESEIIREWVLQRIAQDKGTNQVRCQSRPQ